MTEEALRQPVARRPAIRWPAEWEPHEATWLAWPHNPETWPGCVEAAERTHAAMVAALQGREEVRILVNDRAAEDRARRVLEASGVDSDAGVRFFEIPTDDAWIRDTGPVFVARGADRLACCFRFDTWGGKYPPWDRDAAVAEGIAAGCGVASRAADFVLEGGSIDGNGDGTILTTERCLLNSNRANPGETRTREGMEARLADWLGATQVLWLGDGIEGDDTDGHVDDIARFVAPTTVVTVVEEDASDANHAILAENLQRLRGMTDGRGKPLDVVPLPMPPAVVVDGFRRPASYANFYLANGVALVPVFDAPSDARALAVLAECLPDRDVIAVPSRDLVVGLGALHCATQQQPA